MALYPLWALWATPQVSPPSAIPKGCQDRAVTRWGMHGGNHVVCGAVVCGGGVPRALVFGFVVYVHRNGCRASQRGGK